VRKTSLTIASAPTTGTTHHVGELGGVDGGLGRHAAEVDPEDGGAGLEVGRADVEDAIEAAGPQEGRVLCALRGHPKPERPRSARTMTCGRLVAARTVTPLSSSTPSISVSRLVSTRSPVDVLSPESRDAAMASTSSCMAC
jgi:hypothetical protein